MSPFEPLLAIQELDTSADQLRHRHAHLSQRAELESIAEQLLGLDKQQAAIEDRRTVLARDQKRIEDHVAGVEERKHEVNAKLYGEHVTSPKEALAYQEELASLDRRQSGLEDEALAIMELIEPLDAELGELDMQRSDLDARAREVTVSLTEAEIGLDAELETVVQARSAAAQGIEEGLLATYERLRDEQGGIAVARLVGGLCEGCNLSLSAMAVDRFKKLAPEEPAHCEECGRLLVR